jgi:hypothetical protein
MMQMTWIILAIALGLASCGGEQVALNERLFASDTMEPEGGGCSLYELGSGDHVSSREGKIDGALAVNQRLDADTVVVSVDDAGQTIIEKRYDESFFKAGTIDQFTATPSGGGTGLLLRYWGKFHPGGSAGCAPLDQSAP